MTEIVKIGSRRVDTTRGTSSGVLSSEWYRRPKDERYLDMPSLHSMLKARSDRSRPMTIETNTVKVVGHVTDPEKLQLVLPDESLVDPTHWSFGQICDVAKAPAGYIRRLPSAIAAINMQHGLIVNPSEIAKFYVTLEQEGGEREVLRALTSPGYGRIQDHELTQAVMDVMDDTWKVPGVMDWGSMMYDPDVPVTENTTTLFGSDRDVTLFLCRDQYPIEIGQIPDGKGGMMPDYLFPGFVASNSEVGSGRCYIEMFFMRGICANRNFWGIEGSSLSIRHTSGAPARFLKEAAPILREFAERAARPVIDKVNAARDLKMTQDEVKAKLTKMEYSKPSIAAIIEGAVVMDGHPPESAWDLVQAITANARKIPYQKERLEEERAAGKIMNGI